MKKFTSIIIFVVISLSCYSQNGDNIFAQRLYDIKVLKGDSIARNYLETKRDSLEQIGEFNTYTLFWGLLTSNMWNAAPTETLKQEYKDYLYAIIDDEIISENYKPTKESLPYLWQLVHDYYTMLYNDGDKEQGLSLLTNLLRWFKPYPDLQKAVGYAQSLLDMCDLLIELHKYNEAEPFCREYVEVARNVYGESSSQYAVALYYLTFSPQMSHQEIIENLKHAISICELLGDSNNDVYIPIKRRYDLVVALTTGQSNTENIDISQNEMLPLEDCLRLVVSGRGQLAIESLVKHKDLLRNNEKLDTLGYTTIIQNLIYSYIQIGDLSKAQNEIDTFDNTIGINLQTLPPGYFQVFCSYGGLIAYHLKDYVKALRFFMAALNMLERAGVYGIEYCKVLEQIAVVYADLGQTRDSKWYLDAKWYIDEAISIYKETVGSLAQHGSLGSIMLLSNKALVYEGIGDRADAIKTLEYIVDNFSTDVDVKEAWCLAVNNLANLYMKDGQWGKGTKLLENLLALDVIDDNKMRYMVTQNLALCHLYEGNHQKAITTLMEMNKYSLNDIAQIFSNFIAKDRDEYWTQIAKERMFINNLIAYHTNDGEAIAIAYNNALFSKNLLLKSTKLLEQFIENSDNDSIKNEYASSV